MKDLLLADAGSTKTDWSLLSDTQNVSVRVQTKGINPALTPQKEILEIMKTLPDKLKSSRPKRICFFGAGCATPSLKEIVKESLSETFQVGDITVESDLMAAAIALFGDSKGIVGILGTGSNCGIYQAGKLNQPIPSLGYILGDEGSGVSLGKRLLNAVFKKQLADELIKKFIYEYELNLPTLIDRVYRQSNPSSFIASFSPFLLKTINYPEIYNLVSEEFDSFFKKNILPLRESNSYEIGIVGSIAFNYQSVLRAAAERFGLEIKTVLHNPMSNLENYYSNL